MQPLAYILEASITLLPLPASSVPVIFSKATSLMETINNHQFLSSYHLLGSLLSAKQLAKSFMHINQTLIKIQ